MNLEVNDDVLTDDEQKSLANRVAQLGEVRTAELLRLSRASVLRLLARRPVRLGTLAMVRIGLAKGV